MAVQIEVVESTHSKLSTHQKRVVVLGNIDGFHRGHQQLVGQALNLGNRLGHPVWLATFDPHPLEVLKPGSGFLRIFSRQQQQQILAGTGLQGIYYFQFNTELSQATPENFLEKYLFQGLNPSAVVVGFNFRFGINRTGGPEELAHWGQKKNILIEVVQPFKHQDQVVSSTLVRKDLLLGQVDLANQLLGFPFYIEGVVETGAGRGIQLGFPTANIRAPKTLIPAFGVYATIAEIQGKKLPAVSHLGPLPSFDDAQARLETHVLDGSWNFRGDPMKVHFLKRIREVMKFDSVESLKRQIQTDIQTARGIHGYT